MFLAGRALRAWRRGDDSDEAVAGSMLEAASMCATIAIAEGLSGAGKK